MIFVYIIYKMGTEYVKLSGAERIHGQKELLMCQLETLSLIKSFRNYKLLRKEEMELKVLLKTKVEEAIALSEKLEGVLPKTKFTPEMKREKKMMSREHLTLQGEIDEIRRKIERLQSC